MDPGERSEGEERARRMKLFERGEEGGITAERINKRMGNE
jgi:hypothetical protein